MGYNTLYKDSFLSIVQDTRDIESRMKKPPIKFEQYIKGEWVYVESSKGLIKGYEARIMSEFEYMIMMETQRRKLQHRLWR